MTTNDKNTMPPPLPNGEPWRQRWWREGFAAQLSPIYEAQDAHGHHYRTLCLEARHLNGRGVAHGGMLMAFADMAFGTVASNANRYYWVTVRLMVDFLSPAKKGEWLSGTGTVFGQTDKLVTVQGHLRCNDRVVLSGSGLFKLIGDRPQED